MNRDNAKDYIRRNYAAYLKPAKKKNTYICPLCGNGTGSTGDGMEVDPHGDGLHLKCFKPTCNFYGDLIELYQQEHNCTQQEAFDGLYSYFGIVIDDDYTQPKKPVTEAQNAPQVQEVRDYSNYYKECCKRLSDPAAVAYLELRGISLQTATSFFIGYDPEWRSPAAIASGKNPPSSPRLIIPTSRSSYIARDIRQDLPEAAKPYAKMKEGGVRAFNLEALKNTDQKPVFITEGEIDALSIIEAGGLAMALGSAGRRLKFVEYLQKNPTSCMLILSLDNDEAGQAAQRELADALQGLNIPFITADICDQYKDPNEALTGDREAFIASVGEAEAEAVAKVQEAQKERDKITGAAMVDAFLEKVQTRTYEPLPTGIKDLDRITGGGFLRQTIVMLAAAPAMGKTTFTMQLFEGMAKQGADVIYLNLEMSREQLIAKSLCRTAYTTSRISLKTSEIMQGYKWTPDQKKAVYDAAEAYKRDIAPHMIYNPDNVTPELDSILSFLQAEAKAKKAEGKPAPLVVLDYLHLIQGKPREDAASVIKEAVQRLKDFAMEYETVVFCILATNRDSNQRGRMKLESGRDTSNIEFSADLFLGLNFTDWETVEKSDDDESGDRKKKKPFEVLKRNPNREITLKCLKNRMGTDGESMRLIFDTVHGVFAPASDRTDAPRNSYGSFRG